MNNLGHSKRDKQINKSLKGKLNVSVKSKVEFIEDIQPEEKPFINLPEITEMAIPAPTPEEIQSYRQMCLPYLYSIREPVADYQEKKGIAKDEHYTFATMVMAIGNNMYNSLTAMCAMLGNLVPIFDAILLILRFMIDHTIDILEAEDGTRNAQIGIFFVEVIPIIFIVGFMWGFILFPLYMLFFTVVSKLWTVV